MADAQDYPSVDDFPTIFADGVINLANSPQVAKFYLFRQDPNMLGEPGSKRNVVGQIVMPMESFAVTALFFKNALDGFVAQGLISAQRVAELTKVPQTGGGATPS